MSFLANTCQNIDLGISLETQNLNSFNNFFVRWNVDGLKRRSNALMHSWKLSYYCKEFLFISIWF